MGSYSHVLACVDFSALSRPVLQRAIEEARLRSARLTALNVIEYYPTDVPEGYLVPAENLDPVEAYEARALERLNRLLDEAGCKQAEAAVATATSAAYHEIVQFAEGNAVDLIVMGFHGRWVTGTLGSTAMAATRHVLCDVLLVRQPAGDAAS